MTAQILVSMTTILATPLLRPSFPFPSSNHPPAISPIPFSSGSRAAWHKSLCHTAAPLRGCTSRAVLLPGVAPARAPCHKAVQQLCRDESADCGPGDPHQRRQLLTRLLAAFPRATREPGRRTRVEGGEQSDDWGITPEPGPPSPTTRRPRQAHFRGPCTRRKGRQSFVNRVQKGEKMPPAGGGMRPTGCMRPTLY